MTASSNITDEGFSAEDAINFMMELGGAELLMSTVGLPVKGLTVAVWQLDRLALTMPPTDFHLLAMGLTGNHAGHQSFEALAGASEIRISPGNVSYVPNGQSVLFSGTGDAVVMHLMVDGALMERALEESYSDAADQMAQPWQWKGFNQRVAPAISALGMTILREASLARDGVEMMLDGLSSRLAVALAQDRLGHGGKIKTLAPAGLGETLVSQIITRIEDNLGEQPDPGTLAFDTGLGADLIENGFKVSVGETIRDFWSSARVNRAFCMLVFSSADGVEVARASGFEDEKDMALTIEQVLGHTLSDLRPETE